MAVRAIDGDELLGITRLLDTDVVRQSKTASWLLDQVLHDIQASPTIDQPNEWVSVEKQRDKLIELIVNAKRADPETCSFTEFLADFLLGYGVFVPDDRCDLDRLRELVQAEREGRCVVLPCKVGDKVYWIVDGGVFECFFTIAAAEEVGKTVFLTREAAEEALKAREQE